MDTTHCMAKVLSGLPQKWMPNTDQKQIEEWLSSLAAEDKRSIAIGGCKLAPGRLDGFRDLVSEW